MTRNESTLWSKTLETSDGTGSLGAKWGQAKGSVPRMMLLAHGDVTRLGEVTPPELFAEREAWVEVGRLEPDFVSSHRANEGRQPLLDPGVSRQQFSIRWCPALGMFEVAPHPDARRQLAQVTFGLIPPSARGWETNPITKPTILPPGSVLAIGKRVLLHLDVVPWHSEGDDRLGLVGESKLLWQTRQEILDATQFSSPVLLLGETGTGKELVARAIHEQSPQASGPYVTLNCATIPSQLAESVLFGHTRGAFTGATHKSSGVFQAADQGTLLLDEFGEMPLDIQPKLLRTLQEGQIMPVGQTQPTRVQVRVIASTHRELTAALEQGKMREDLYYRVAAHRIQLAPLVQRREDIPLLFVHFLDRLAEAQPTLREHWQWNDPKRLPFPVSFWLTLMAHDWPGNVRELKNAAEQTVRKALRTGHLSLPELDQEKSHTQPSPPQRAAGGPVAESKSPSSAPSDSHLPAFDTAVSVETLHRLGQPLGMAAKTLHKLVPGEILRSLSDDLSSEGEEQVVEQLQHHAAEELFRLMERHDFNQSQVARDLEISRTTLGKLMDSLQLPRPKDLQWEEIQRARTQTGGDLDAMARQLRVSPLGLRHQITRLRLRQSLHSS